MDERVNKMVRQYKLTKIRNSPLNNEVLRIFRTNPDLAFTKYEVVVRLNQSLLYSYKFKSINHYLVSKLNFLTSRGILNRKMNYYILNLEHPFNTA